MSDQILTILKFFLLALIWLFFLRVLRSVWVDIRTAGASEDTPARAGSRPAAPPPPARPAAPAPAAAAPPISPSLPTRVTGPPPDPGAVSLRVLEPPETAGVIYRVNGPLIVGRASSADIALSSDSYVSSSHARLWLENGALLVEDLGSTNGTTLNGAPLSGTRRLRSGDRLGIGRTIFEVVAP